MSGRDLSIRIAASPVPLPVLTYTLARVRAVLDLTSQLQTSEFPQPYCEEGIHLIATEFRQRKELIEKFTDETDPEIVHAACQDLLNTLFELLPILGFFLRSTNVRNAFELHAPLARLAKKLVSDVKLVLSSEWDFSPFTYHQMVSLPRYVLIGLPASESANGLALPLAGHELGHAVWAQEGLDREFNLKIATALVSEIQSRWNEYHLHFSQVSLEALEDLSGYRTWQPAYRWATSQAQECFCDQFGVRVFGESYLHAFAYLLAPGLPARNPAYPSNRRRAENLVEACKRWGLSVPGNYVGNFRDGTSRLEGSVEFLCSVADRAVDALAGDLLERCHQISKEAEVPLQDEQEITKIVEAFRKLVPGTEAKSLCSITNAGWRAFHDPTFWSNYAHIRERKPVVLNELLLKTVEVFEVEAKLKEE